MIIDDMFLQFVTPISATIATITLAEREIDIVSCCSDLSVLSIFKLD